MTYQDLVPILMEKMVEPNLPFQNFHAATDVILKGNLNPRDYTYRGVIHTTLEQSCCLEKKDSPDHLMQHFLAAIGDMADVPGRWISMIDIIIEPRK